MRKIAFQDILTTVVAVAVLGFAVVVIHQQSQQQAISQASQVNNPFVVMDKADAPIVSLATLQTSAGTTVDLAQAVKRGPVVLDFWATYCVPCHMLAPLMSQVALLYQSHGVQFYGVDASDTPDQINVFLKAHPSSYPTLVDANAALSTNFAVSGIPAVFVIDRAGRIRATSVGYDETAVGDLSNCLDKLLSE
jgi:thiol-disulfide isomerase/thioredoxin